MNLFLLQISSILLLVNYHWAKCLQVDNIGDGNTSFESSENSVGYILVAEGNGESLDVELEGEDQEISDRNEIDYSLSVDDSNDSELSTKSSLSPQKLQTIYDFLDTVLIDRIPDEMRKEIMSRVKKPLVEIVADYYKDEFRKEISEYNEAIWNQVKKSIKSCLAKDSRGNCQLI